MNSLSVGHNIRFFNSENKVTFGGWILCRPDDTVTDHSSTQKIRLTHIIVLVPLSMTIVQYTRGRRESRPGVYVSPWNHDLESRPGGFIQCSKKGWLLCWLDVTHHFSTQKTIRLRSVNEFSVGWIGCVTSKTRITTWWTDVTDLTWVLRG